MYLLAPLLTGMELNDVTILIHFQIGIVVGAV
jgi:hypothetical protein